MKTKNPYFLFIFLTISILSCKKNSDNFTENSKLDLKYIKNISLNEENNIIKINYSNIDYNVSLDKKILPLKNIVLLSSAAVGYLENINALNNISAVYDAQWTFSPKLHSKIENNEIKDLGNSATANIEQIISLKPDAVITFTDPSKAKLVEQIKQQKIPVIFLDEYLETQPLAKAEYIKLFGFLTNKQNTADSLFSIVEQNYLTLKAKTENIKNKPTVITNIMRGDVWYMSGGKSFNANFINDAGGNFIWKNNNDTGSVLLSFEEVLSKGKNADFWINASNFKTYEELSNAYKNNKLFKAFETKSVYNPIKRENTNMANDIYETGNVRPDWVLEDLIHIFHPEILPNHKFVFYKALD
ncbi:ABC transporter substrate-binding protein [Weeksellaceae bacterium TAE3-ERU29]|nr:ABC transporter substrate-binding protein [Weeksellaceae bacterium TAE3-ERU29]